MKKLVFVCAILLAGYIALSVHGIVEADIRIHEAYLDQHGNERADYGWDLHTRTYTFILPSGHKLTFAEEDVIHDPSVGDNETFIEIIEDDVRLHVPYSL